MQLQCVNTVAVHNCCCSAQVQLQCTSSVAVHKCSCSAQMQLQCTSAVAVRKYSCSAQVQFQFTSAVSVQKCSCNAQVTIAMHESQINSFTRSSTRTSEWRSMWLSEWVSQFHSLTQMRGRGNNVLSLDTFSSSFICWGSVAGRLGYFSFSLILPVTLCPCRPEACRGLVCKVNENFKGNFWIWFIIDYNLNLK